MLARLINQKKTNKMLEGILLAKREDNFYLFIFIYFLFLFYFIYSCKLAKGLPTSFSKLILRLPKVQQQQQNKKQSK